MLARLERVGDDVEAGDLGASARRRQVAGEDAHGGGLAGAVGAEKTEHLTAFDVKRNVGHRHARAVVLGEVFDANHATRLPQGVRMDGPWILLVRLYARTSLRSRPKSARQWGGLRPAGV